MSERGMLRPGGLELTGRLIELSGLQPGANILDVGCGEGATVAWLRTACNMHAIGLDAQAPPDPDPQCPILRGNAGMVDTLFKECSLDAVLCECSFSLFENGPDVLRRFNQILKPEGLLLLTDLYSRTEAACLKGGANYLYTEAGLRDMMEHNGFEVTGFEDHSRTLREMAARMIFEQGAENLYRGIGSSFEEMKRLKCGYFILTAKTEGLAAVSPFPDKQTAGGCPQSRKTGGKKHDRCYCYFQN